jgi:uncharacterized protein YcbK (DUF882 family)
VDEILRRLPGLTVTSTRRTRSRNRQVGGVASSLHLSGRACDLAGTRTEQVAAVAMARLANAKEAVDEGDHAHVAW